MSADAVSMVGESLETAANTLGEPDFRHAVDATEYVGYRIHTFAQSPVRRCSVIFVVDDEQIIEARLAGLSCHETNRKPMKVNQLAEQLKGKTIPEVVTMLGTPDALLTDNPPTDSDLVMIYSLGSNQIGTFESGGTLGVGAQVSCTMTLTADSAGTVIKSETGGGNCWATLF